MKAIDLVYVLGTGSIWKNNEMRYSLRSVHKNLTGVRNIYIIGEDPGFLTSKAIHIYHPDEIKVTRNADGNMALKILRACQESDLSGDFLFMNDDFIINKPIVAAEIPWLHKKDMATRDNKYWTSQFYRYRLHRTYKILKERGLPTMQYDYHAPMLMNKHRFPEVMAQFGFREDIGYTFRSLYGNSLALPCEHIGQWKVTVYTPMVVKKIEEHTAKATFVGYNDKGMNASLKYWIQSRYPDMSPYENRPPAEDAADLSRWLQNPDDFAEGIKLFVKYSRAGNLSPRVNLAKTPALRERLFQKLTDIHNKL